jgi:hypothetical protein
LAAVQKFKRIDAKYEPDQQKNDDATYAEPATAADRHPYAATRHAEASARAAAVFNILTGSFTSEPHGVSPICSN